MKIVAIVSVAATLALTTMAQAQDFGVDLSQGRPLDAQQDPEILRIAVESGVCGDRDVVRATLQADASILAECEEDPTAFVPLAGGLALPIGAAAAGLVAIAAAGGGGDATPDTQ